MASQALSPMTQQQHSGILSILFSAQSSGSNLRSGFNLAKFMVWLPFTKEMFRCFITRGSGATFQAATFVINKSSWHCGDIKGDF
jgi:hypothetical protein